MKENITDKEKKKIEEMTNELVAIVPMVKPKEDSYTDYCKQIATALRNVGYSKETIIVKEFAEKIMEKNCRNCEHAFLETCKGCNTLPPNNTYENFELRKDITAEKHRADVAEEALRLAFDEWTCCDSCMFSFDCKTNRTDCKKAEISKIKQQAEARLNELQGEVE